MKQNKKQMPKKKKTTAYFDIEAISEAMTPFAGDDADALIRAAIKKHHIPYCDLYCGEESFYVFAIWAGGKELFIDLCESVLGRKIDIRYDSTAFSKLWVFVTPIECIEVQIKYDHFVEKYNTIQKTLRNNFVSDHAPFNEPIPDDDVSISDKVYTINEILGALRFGYGHGKSNDTLIADDNYFKQLFLAYMEFAGLD